MERSILSRKSERAVGIEIQTPAGRRPRGTRQIEAHEPVDEARADADPSQRADEREVLARSRAPGIGEQDDARRGPAIGELEPCAPERVPARRVATITAHRAGAAEIPVALHRNHARSE